jgi:hypothetical protein
MVFYGFVFVDFDFETPTIGNPPTLPAERRAAFDKNPSGHSSWIFVIVAINLKVPQCASVVAGFPFQ